MTGGSGEQTTGAKAALDGYDYQIKVSLFVALRILLISKSASQITLEPANAEDLEADLAPEVPGRVEPRAEVAEGYRLIIQVKHVTTGPWSLTEIRNLMDHGVQRPKAARHLDDPGVRYLLITSADVSNTARGLKVDALEEWPSPDSFPASLRSLMPNAPEGRLAILGQLQPRLLDLELDQALGLLHVPRDRRADCLEELRREAERRMRGLAPGVWTREDLIASIRRCGGFLASAAELEDFVPPANFKHMVDHLVRKSAIVITGPSGTGKTTSALALCDMMRRRRSDVSVVAVDPSAGPAALRATTQTGPKIFYIEDPWGQYSLIDRSEGWTAQLPRMLKERASDRLYVITSRTDVLRNAQAETGLKPWSIALEAEHYESGELARIYDRRSSGLPVELQSFALDFRSRVLDALETPLELHLYFDALSEKATEGLEPHALLSLLLTLAHRDAVEGEVIRYLRSHGDPAAAAGVWALIAATASPGRERLIAVQRQLRASGDGPTPELVRLVDRLVATRHLKQPARTVSFAHPSVRQGFEAFIRRHWLDVEVPLAALVSALTTLPDAHRDWGLETSARLIRAVESLLASSRQPDPDETPDEQAEAEMADMADAVFDVPAPAQQAVDRWLEEALGDPASEFRAILDLAADVGGPESNPSELARWFIKGVRRGGQFFLDDWQPPEFDGAWYDRIAADPRSARIADRFIREVLPTDDASYGRGFVERLERIAGDLTPAYLAAAARLVGAGFDRNVTMIAIGAARDLDAYETVLTASLDMIDMEDRRYRQSGALTWREIQDGEHDASAEEGFSHDYEDSGYADRELVEAYVEGRRLSGAWPLLAAHPRRDELLYDWARAVQGASDPVDADEVTTLLDLTMDHHDEAAAWDAAGSHWRPDLEARLEARLADNPANAQLRAGLLHAALVNGQAVDTVARRLQVVAGDPGLLVRTLLDLQRAARQLGSKDNARVKALIRALSAPAPQLWVALGRAPETAAKRMDAVALQVLEDACATATLDELAAIVPILVAAGRPPQSAIMRWLEADDVDGAAGAARAAAASGDEALIQRALVHARADAREIALRTLIARSGDPLPDALLRLASDRGSRVRRALVAGLSTRSDPSHLPVLRRLIQDTWSNDDPRYDEPPSYPIALEAVAALSGYGSLGDDLVIDLVALGQNTKDRTLRQRSFALAAAQGGSAIQNSLWSLALADPPSWIGVDAIDALVEAPLIDPAIPTAISSDLLLSLVPPLAASATVLLAQHAVPTEAADRLERVGHSNKRRVLTVLGAAVLRDREQDAAARLLALFEANHPVQALLTLKDEDRLPASALDDLGSPRVRKAAATWLAPLLATKT